MSAFEYVHPLTKRSMEPVFASVGGVQVLTCLLRLLVESSVMTLVVNMDGFLSKQVSCALKKSRARSTYFRHSNLTLNFP